MLLYSNFQIFPQNCQLYHRQLESLEHFNVYIILMIPYYCTKRIQPARGWCANCIHLPRLSGGPATQFFGEASRVPPAAWLAERLLIAGDIESNPGPKPTLKTLSHTQPPTLTKYTSSSVQPPRTCPSPLSLVHAPPKTPTSIQPPKTPALTPYTINRIQHTRPDSPHISPSHKLPYVTTPAPHIPTHETNKQNTEIKILQINANGIRSTVEELKHLMCTTPPDVVAIQESKHTPASRTPKIPHFTAIHTDRKHKQGGGLITRRVESILILEGRNLNK